MTYEEAAAGPRDVEAAFDDNPRGREHNEETSAGRSWWRCVPIADAVEAAAGPRPAASTTPQARDEGLVVGAVATALRERKVGLGTEAHVLRELRAALAKAED